MEVGFLEKILKFYQPQQVGILQRVLKGLKEIKDSKTFLLQAKQQFTKAILFTDVFLQLLSVALSSAPRADS